MDGSAGSKTTACWLALALAISGVITLEMTGHVSLQPALAPAPPSRSPDLRPASTPAKAPAIEPIDDIVSRPLFALSRRPAPPLATDPAGPAAPRRASEVMKLIGIVHAGEASLALLRHDEHGMIRRRAGEEVDGWQVDRIEQARIRLRRDSQAEWLALHKPPVIETIGNAQLALASGGQPGSSALSEPMETLHAGGEASPVRR